MNQDETFENNSDIEHQLRSLGETLAWKVSLSQRVLEELEAVDQIPHSEPMVAPRIFNSFGKLTMFQKISFAGIAASVALVAMFWLASSTGSVSFAQVVENVRKANSYKAEVRMGDLKDMGQNQPNATGTYYWRAPLEVRMETHRTHGGDSIEIFFRDKAGIHLDSNTKTYRVTDARAGASSPIMQLQQLSSFKAKAQKQLGGKLIDGRLCDGFEVKLSEIDANAGDGTLTAWVDRKTQLPVSVVMRVDTPLPYVMVMENIVWNTKLDDSLFSTEPPDGFEPAKPSQRDMRNVAEKATSIAAALRTFAELNHGKYPQVKVIYGDVVLNTMRELAGFSPRLSEQQVKDPRYAQIMSSSLGWGTMTQIMRNDAEASYHGIDVSPDDGDKVLFRWKTDEGTFQVIYGDLRTATVPE